MVCPPKSQGPHSSIGPLGHFICTDQAFQVANVPFREFMLISVEQSGADLGNVAHGRYGAFIFHSSGSYNTQSSHDAVSIMIRRQDERALVHFAAEVFPADQNLKAASMGLQTGVQYLYQLCFFLQRFEKVLNLPDILEFRPGKDLGGPIYK